MTLQMAMVDSTAAHAIQNPPFDNSGTPPSGGGSPCSRVSNGLCKVTAALIREYTSIEQELAPLQNYEDQRQALDCQVASVLDEIGRLQSQLNQTQEDEAHMQKRVHRNKNPRFLHYFVWNREAKVERLTGELQQLQSRGEDLSNKLSVDSAQLPGLQQRQHHAHIIMDRKLQMEGQSHQLRNQVIDSQPPTQVLKQLSAGDQQQRSLLASDQMLLEAVRDSVQQVRQGLSLFQEAKDLYRQARSINERAKTVNSEEGRDDEAVRSYAGEGNAERDRQRLQKLSNVTIYWLAKERELQNLRDETINQANDVAMQAYQAITTAFTHFSAEARARFPQLCESIGQEAFPQVQGASFTGALMGSAIFDTFGAPMNDMISDTQIQDNMRVVGQCVSMTSQQLGLMTSLQNTAATNVRELEASIENLKQNIVVERNHIFNGVKSSVIAARAA